MADEFDWFLGEELAPPERRPDRQFVVRVQTHIALEDRFTAQQHSLIVGLVKQVVALIVVACAIWWVARAAPVADWFAESPAVALAILLAGFVFLVGTLSFRSVDRLRPAVFR
jgi:hypothetical protein